MESWKVVHKNYMEKKASVIVKDIGIIENKHGPFKSMCSAFQHHES